MIGALAFAGKQLNEPRFIAAAERAAGFVLTAMRKDGRLLRSYRQGEAGLNAYLDDYAFLADGLLDLRDATGERAMAGRGEVARGGDEGAFLGPRRTAASS